MIYNILKIIWFVSINFVNQPSEYEIERLREKLSGLWGWDYPGYELSCSGIKHRIHLNDKEFQVIITYEEIVRQGDISFQKIAYKILEIREDSIRLKLLGGEKKSDEVDIWDMIFVSSGYSWHRSDWPNDTTTRNIVRCDEIT